ncbi:putative metallocarboxypeptidase ecm14 [Lithohypha guttulata]|uniref:putative metallocarboxypeptidase ecm14 n=1 Tax=Lithohypha guttulata TaxID=1690604 RepID=UPI002DDEEC94|nr:putative metallocarboxypeptidase ecm14 [Lithohypha guttulata]
MPERAADHLFLCLFFVTASFSTPTSVSQLYEQSLRTQDPVPIPSRPSFLTKLCAEIIEKIWPHYKKASSRASKPQSASPSKVLSKYGDDVVLRFRLRTQNEASAFAEAVEGLYLDLWEASDDWADVRISQKVLPSFLTLLPASMQQSHTPVITQLSQAVYHTFPTAQATDSWRHRTSLDRPHDLFFENYQPLSVLYPWLRQLASMFPDTTELSSIGTTYEGRDIPALRIGIPLPDDDPHKDDPRHTVVIVAGGHAREWISVSTAAFLLRSLLHNYDHKQKDTVYKLLTHYDFVFMPVLNPDGYEYTWTTDRLWRKNRQETALPFCRGIDFDRAFPFGWNGDNQTDNPCSEAYAGEHPLQAVEAQRLYDWAKNESSSRKFTAFIDLHSYSQEILYPYSYTCYRRPSNLEDLEELAVGLAKAFRTTNGHHYGVESACEGSMLNTATSTKDTGMVRTRIVESGGSALDFFYHDLQVKYAFQVKLRDTGSYGFLLPKENILPTGVETFSALLGLGKWLLGNRGIEGYANLSDDEIWGKEEVTINGFDVIQETNDDADEDEGGSWFRRKR